MSDLVVKAPAVQVLGENGQYTHLYQDAPVPTLAEGEADRLKSEGLIGPEDSDFIAGEWTGDGDNRKYTEPKWVKKGSAAAKKADESTGANK